MKNAIKAMSIIWSDFLIILNSHLMSLIRLQYKFTSLALKLFSALALIYHLGFFRSINRFANNWLYFPEYFKVNNISVMAPGGGKKITYHF